MADEPHLSVETNFDLEGIKESAAEAKDQGFDYFHIHMEGVGGVTYEEPTLTLSLLGQGSNYQYAHEPAGIYYVGTIELDDA